MQLIDTDAELVRLAKELGDASTFYIDTEFESAKRGKTLSLVQLSTGGSPYLIDALRLGRLEPIAETVATPERLWVLHAGLQDVELLLQAFAAREVPRLFDTQIAWGLMGPEASVSLSYLEYRLLGLRSMKTHQADDWLRRPLPASQLQYAAKDIEHLPEIHLELVNRATALGRDELIEAACRELLAPNPEPPGPVKVASFRNAWQLEPANQAALEFLVNWYNALSDRERLDAPSPKTFLSIASRLPKSGRELSRIKGIPGRWCARHGQRLAKKLNLAAAKSQRDDFEPLEPPPYATYDDLRLDGWLAYMRAEVCARARVAPEIAFNQRVLRRIKRAIEAAGERRAGADALEGWRSKILREPYLELCEQLR